jgi:hypothetical protein
VPLPEVVSVVEIRSHGLPSTLHELKEAASVVHFTVCSDMKEAKR